jgi:peptidoglycan/xylan/chitin deacetylase (PgdA/CDA1 family)
VAVEQNGGALDYVPEDKLTARCKSRLRARRRRRGMRVENWNGHGIRFVDKDGEWWAVAKDGGIVLLHEPYAKTRAALPPIVNTLRSRGYDITTVGALATQKQITLKAGVCYNAL